jgi:hypothetical protein
MDNIAQIIILIFILVGVFLLIRSIVLWYWKVDEMIKIQNDQKILMKEQRDLLKQIFRLQGGILKDYQVSDSEEEINRKAKLYDQHQNK